MSNTINMTPQHQVSKTAVLLINLGSPEAPTKEALRPYLREFLSDPRVIDLPRWQWLPVLYGVVLRTRPQKSAEVYQQIWTDDGAPLILITEQQTQALKDKLADNGLGHIMVDYAMRYGQPSIASKLAGLKAQGVERILVVPMYPQYADATTASVFDGVAQALATMRNVPELRFIRSWHDHELYIQALADSISAHFAEHGQADKLLFSYHGVPKRFLAEGDPYFCHCHKTTRLVVEKLGLDSERYQMVFQSLFGKEEWLKPYADVTIEQLAKDGVKKVAVICPGFSADCLETLEEMAIGNRDLFLSSGGEQYTYVPALNAQDDHINLLYNLVRQHGQGWADFSEHSEENKVAKDDARANYWLEKQKVAE